MKLLRAALLVFLVGALALQLGGAHAQSSSCVSRSGYYVASLNAGIDPGAANFMSTSVANAEAACDGHLVFVLSTNGGDGASMESMIDSVLSYEAWNGTFVTLVAPTGATAWSAGSYIAEASNFIYMAEGTVIGSSTPIVSGIPTGEVNTTLTKDINAFTAYMGSLTSQNGRNATATELMVTKGVDYSATAALKDHVINQVINATSVSSALAAIGVPAGTPIDTPGLQSILISVLSNANVSTLLFLVGIFAVLIDIFHPTLVLSVAGIAAMAAALYGLGVYGASPLAILLMIVGAAFIFLEVKTQHGVSAAMGVVIFAFGFLLIFQFPPAGPSQPAQSLPPAGFSGVPWTSYAFLAVIGALIVAASFYLRSVRRSMMAAPKANDPARAVGKTGTMKTDLPLGGKGVALVGAEMWTVVSDQALVKGDAVKVKELRGLELVVEKAA